MALTMHQRRRLAAAAAPKPRRERRVYSEADRIAHSILAGVALAAALVMLFHGTGGVL